MRLRARQKLAIDPHPLATMGGAEAAPSYDLTHAYHVALLADGRVAALAPIGSRFMLFGADGKGIRVWGRVGKGPGDLMAPGGLVPYNGDTLLIPDLNNQRNNLVLPEQGVIGMRPLPLSTKMYLGATAGALPDGRIVLHSAGWFGMQRDTLGRTVAFGDDRVVVRATDENDVVAFRVYRIIPDRN